MERRETSRSPAVLGKKSLVSGGYYSTPTILRDDVARLGRHPKFWRSGLFVCTALVTLWRGKKAALRCVQRRLSDLTRKRRGWRYEIPPFFSSLSLRKLFSSLFRRRSLLRPISEIGSRRIYIRVSVSPQLYEKLPKQRAVLLIRCDKERDIVLRSIRRHNTYLCDVSLELQCYTRHLMCA